MKRLDRYVLREFLAPLTICLVAFCTIFVVLDLFNQMAKFSQYQTPARYIAYFYLAYMSGKIEFFIPPSVLMATLYAFWRFTRSNELTAMRACGIGLHRIVQPILGTALLLSIAVGICKETVSPWAGQWAYDFQHNRYSTQMQNIVRDHPYYNSSADRQWVIGQMDAMHPHVLENVRLSIERQDQTRSAVITTERAEWLDGTWWFYSPWIQHFDAADNPQSKPVPAAPGLDPVVEMPHISETPRDITSELRRSEFFSARDIARFLRMKPDLSAKERNIKTTDFHARFAMPLAAFIMALFSIPAGARTGRQNALVGIFIAFALLLTFYGLTWAGIILGHCGMIPPWLGAWAANFVSIIIGITLLFRFR